MSPMVSVWLILYPLYLQKLTVWYYCIVALVFIDKYTQVPRILAPIAQCIERLPQLVEDAAFHRYVSEEWGSISSLRMQILSDFFKHGFDGSGTVLYIYSHDYPWLILTHCVPRR